MPNDGSTMEITALSSADHRRLDIDAKQQLIAQLLHDSGCDGLLILHPANFRWLTAGADPVGLYGRDEVPGLFFNSQQRWLLSSALDSARMFAENLDGLGFQLKEWHWTSSREQMLADLVFGRKTACDQPFRDCKHAGTFFTLERRKMSKYEVECLVELGRVVAHGVEATARNFVWGDTEEEIAGHIAHRLLRHGVEPLALQVTGDQRGREFRRRGHHPDPVERSCCLQATGRMHGLHVTVARTVFRSPRDDIERAEFEACLRLRAIHLASAKAGERVMGTIDAGKALLKPTAFEHEWWAAPAIALTGREPSEGVFLPGAQDRWTPGWTVLLQERIGAAAVVDTYLFDADEWRLLTISGDWPIRRAMIPGRSFEMPDMLVREQ